MKKRNVALILTTAMAASMMTGFGVQAEEPIKMGITIQSLENTYWAGVMASLEEQLTEKGYEYTLLACDDNSATQIGQIESFISAECDLIMVHPSDPAAVEDVCAQAREAGIKVMCWDDAMENTDGNWILDNTALGAEIGKLAGAFINEHFSEDEQAHVAVIGYPQTPVLLERADGIKAGLEETAAGKYEIVAEFAAIEATDALTGMETALQADPDIKVVCSIGAGGNIGSNEALMTFTNGEVPEDMGIFTTDVSKQQLESLMGDEATKGIIGFEGSDDDTAAACIEMMEKILNDEVGDEKNVYRVTGPITEENVEEIMAGMN